VLEHLVRHICDHKESPDGSAVSHIQTSFDLLGEIIKYDVETVTLLERVLLTEGLMDRFMEVTMTSVVDSNVFLRSLLLTMHAISAHCRANGMTSHSESDMDAKAAGDADCVNGDNEDDGNAGAKEVSPGKQTSIAPSLCYLPPSCAARRGSYDLVATSIAAPVARPSIPSPFSSGAATTSSSHGVSRIADVGYLSHSWVQFSPSILSEEAMRVAEEHNKASPSHRIKQSDRGTDKKADIARPSSISFASIRNAIKNIRRVTSSLLGRDGSSTSAPSSPVMSCAAAVDSMSFDTGATPECVAEGAGEARHRALLAAAAGRRAEAVGGTYCHEWTLPGEVRLLSSFLQQHEENIIYEMMTAVTVGSITHENVCCVNTTLLSLIFAHKR
jgi:hypothetical protein